VERTGHVNELAARWALEAAGVEFIDENIVAQACDFRERVGMANLILSPTSYAHATTRC